MSPTSAPPAPPPVKVDPRLRARRIAVRREEGRRRLRRLALAGGTLTVGALLWGLTRSPLLDVDRVDVRGAEHTPVEAVQAASGVHLGEAMTEVDLGSARRRVVGLPWVDDVVVRRRWPGTVSIVVRERRAAAAVPARRGRWALIDREARVLAVVANPPGRLRRLEGLPLAGAPASTVGGRAGELLLVARSLPTEVARQVAAVVQAGERDIRLRLVDGATVWLGDVGQLDAKVLDLATLLVSVDPTGRDVIDVRVPGSSAIRRRP